MTVSLRQKNHLIFLSLGLIFLDKRLAEASQYTQDSVSYFIELIFSFQR